MIVVMVVVGVTAGWLVIDWFRVGGGRGLTESRMVYRCASQMAVCFGVREGSWERGPQQSTKKKRGKERENTRQRCEHCVHCGVNLAGAGIRPLSSCFPLA